MSKPIPPYLKLHRDDGTEKVDVPPPPDCAAIEAVCEAFREATGWGLEYQPDSDFATRQDADLMWSAPVSPGVGTAPGLLRIERGESSDDTARLEWTAAEKLVQSLSMLVNDALRMRHALWQREAELAAGIPLVASPEDGARLAEGLQAILKAGAEALECEAAALYVLDDATSQLKLRSRWGLPFELFIEPARPLRGAIADLEALLGHAVVLEDTRLFSSWNVPDCAGFEAAVCVPVSTPTVPLGTLWLFSRKARAFDDRQTNLIEVIAGRLAAELERAILLGQAREQAKLTRTVNLDEPLPPPRAPLVPPIVEGHDVAGWTSPDEELGNSFVDWFMLPDQSLAVVLGQSTAGGVAGAMGAAALRAVVRGVGELESKPREVLAAANRTLWTTSAGDQMAGLFYAVLDPCKGRLRYAVAGNLDAGVLRRGKSAHLNCTGLMLGVDPDATFEEQQLDLSAGQALAITTRALALVGDANESSASTINWLEQSEPFLVDAAESLANVVRRQLPNGGRDQAVLVVKRRSPR